MNITAVRDTPVERVRTEFACNRTSEGGVEIIIDQSTYDKYKDRYKPSKLVIFSLTDDQIEQLKTML